MVVASFRFVNRISIVSGETPGMFACAIQPLESRVMQLRSILVGCSVLALISGPSAAETIEIGASLSGGNEVPPVTSGGSGDAAVTVDTHT
ncbi:MAG: hypothetical protein VW644_10595, partial [Alphaproteobacteria bacterium]